MQFLPPGSLVGDINTIFNIELKLGGNPINPSDIVDGITWLQNAFLEEMRCLGPGFSWSNRQVGNDRVYSKIDWVFWNEEWNDA